MTPARDNAVPPDATAVLRRLLSLRWLSLLVMLATGFLLPPLLGITLPQSALLAIVLALVSANLFSLAWLSRRTPTVPGTTALMLQLLLDIAAWSIFLYFTGGATNPLISILLPLVAIGATILPARLAWLLAAAAIAAYSLLWNFFRPLVISDEALAMRWHLAGMWMTFALSAAVIVGFVVRLNAALRARDAALADARAAIARDEHIVALGNLAAGTAHNLGTPLGTMRIVIDELLRAPPDAAALRQDIDLLGEQVDNCRHALARLTAESGSARAEGGRPDSVADWLQSVVSAWQAQRPGFAVEVHCAAAVAGVTVVADATLSQALHTLVNNAADAQAGAPAAGIEVLARADDGLLVIEVRDRGGGMSDAQRADAGRAPASRATGNGMGIGLFLARQALERCGGALAFAPRDGGGTLARMTLPLARITVTPSTSTSASTHTPATRTRT